MFEHDLNVPLLKALGLNVPSQSDYVRDPDSTGFVVYSDYIGDGILESGHSDGTVSFYSEDSPNYGDYCIYWTGAGQYQTIGFDFTPVKDLSKLYGQGYAIDSYKSFQGKRITIHVKNGVFPGRMN